MNRHLVRIFGGIRVTDLDDFWGVPAKKETMEMLDLPFARTDPERSPNGSRPIDVNDSRSEPGNTRLSKDDGSMASKLPQIIYISKYIYGNI